MPDNKDLANDASLLKHPIKTLQAKTAAAGALFKGQAELNSAKKDLKKLQADLEKLKEEDDENYETCKDWELGALAMDMSNSSNQDYLDRLMENIDKAKEAKKEVEQKRDLNLKILKKL